MISKDKPVIYYSHPIRGANGEQSTRADMERNCNQAIDNLSWLRWACPHIEWWCPGANDLGFQLLMEDGRINIHDVLWADAEIIRRYCHGILCHGWDASSGMVMEYDLATSLDLPRLWITTYANLCKEWGKFNENVMSLCTLAKERFSERIADSTR